MLVMITVTCLIVSEECILAVQRPHGGTEDGDNFSQLIGLKPRYVGSFVLVLSTKWRRCESRSI
jgi:hypothetical protein